METSIKDYNIEHTATADAATQAGEINILIKQRQPNDRGSTFFIAAGITAGIEAGTVQVLHRNINSEVFLLVDKSAAENTIDLSAPVQRIVLAPLAELKFKYAGLADGNILQITISEQ